MIASIRSAAPCLIGLLAASATMAGDIEGSKDHPIVTRYPGSTITEYDQKDYDEYDLHVEKCVEDKNEWTCRNQHLEGRVTFIRYELPKGRSSLEVFRNYQKALQKAGFQEIFTCVDLAECGAEPSSAASRMHYFGSWKNRYLAAKLSRPEGDVYVAANVVVDSNEGEARLVFVEVKPMESGMVKVNAAALGNDITQTGHTAVYGIYFDSGKADVKPDSEAALSEIARLLQQNSGLKLYVVGHTDNVGDLKSNLDLSRRRAEAVVQVLASKHGIAVSRLIGQGVGPLTPIASNESEAGRARNRRVELVKQ